VIVSWTVCLQQQQQPVRATAVRAGSEDTVEGDGVLAAGAAGIPVEIQWLVEVLVKYGLDQVSLTTSYLYTELTHTHTHTHTHTRICCTLSYIGLMYPSESSTSSALWCTTV